MGASLINEAGLRDADVNIDGTAIASPHTLELQPNGDVFAFVLSWETGRTTMDEQTVLTQIAKLRATAVSNLLPSLNGRFLATAPYRGDGLPDQATAHTFAFWKAIRFVYSVRAGQSVIYLPRPDSFSQGYTNKTDQSRYGAVISTPDTPYDTAHTKYKASVISSDVVTANEVWISNTPAYHPDSGIWSALVKVGTPFSVAGTVTIDYIPLFNVVVTPTPKVFEKPGREDQQLFLQEVNP